MGEIKEKILDLLSTKLVPEGNDLLHFTIERYVDKFFLEAPRLHLHVSSVEDLVKIALGEKVERSIENLPLGKKIDLLKEGMDQAMYKIRRYDNLKGIGAISSLIAKHPDIVKAMGFTSINWHTAWMPREIVLQRPWQDFKGNLRKIKRGEEI